MKSEPKSGSSVGDEELRPDLPIDREAKEKHKCFVCGDTRPPVDELCQSCGYPKD